jgi:DNA polymerase-3 subunit beta
MSTATAEPPVKPDEKEPEPYNGVASATVNTNEFASAIRFVAAVIEKRPKKPILRYLRVEVKPDNTIEVSATDLSMYARATLRIVQTQKPGVCCIDAERLMIGIASMDGEVTEFVPNGGLVRFTSGEGEFTLGQVDPGGYPPMGPHELEETAGVQVDGPKFVDAVKRVAFAIDTGSKSASSVTGVQIRPKGQQLVAEATDGRRAAQAFIAFEGKKTDSAIAPRQFLPHLYAVCQQAGPASIKIDDSAIVVQSGDFVAGSNLLEGAFPVADDVFPSEAETVIQMDREPFAVAVANALRLCPADDKYKPSAKLTVSLGGLLFDCRKGIEGSSKRLVAKVEGPPIEIGINTLFLLEALRAAEDEKVVLKFTHPNRPIEIQGATPDEWRSITMPVRLEAINLSV